MARPVRVLDPAAPPADILVALERALDGSGPALVPGMAGGVGGAGLPQTDAGLPRQVDDETALLLPTSGSTGPAKLVRLPAAALLASAHATHARIGPPGRWVLTLPMTHVAGWQVLVRGLLAPTASRLPLTYPYRTPFSAGTFQRLLAQDPGPPPEYVALVPTQLARLLNDSAADRAILVGLTVLLGGAAAPADLLHRAARLGVRVVTTYGSTETSGGCVYDGRPLRGVRGRLLPDGRLALGGPVIAAGYLDRTGHPDRPGTVEAPFSTDPDGTRWFTTRDLARTLPDGRLEILGRADDVIVTGGEKVHPLAVERMLMELGADEVVIVGIPDPEWGERVVAVTTTAKPDLDHWRTHVRSRLGGFAAPRQVVVVPELPLLGIGKPDRVAARGLAMRDTFGHE